MKVLYFVAPYQNFTGSQQSLAFVISRLPGNIGPRVVFPGHGKAVEGFRALGIPTAVVRAPSALNVFEKQLLHQSKLKQGALFLRYLIPYTIQLWQYIRQEQPEIIHCNDSRSVLMSAWAARLARKPVIWHLRGENQLRHYHLLNGLTCYLTTTVVAVADALRSSIGKDLPCRTIYNGIDPTIYKTSPEVEQAINRMLQERGFEPTQTARLLTASSLVPYKGHHYLLEGLGRLFTEHLSLAKHLAWFILGDANTEERQEYQAFLLARARQLGLEANIHWLGWQDNAFAWIAAADMVILPTVQSGIFKFPDGRQVRLYCTEGFPRTVLEAMAAGVPVIASNVAGTREAVIHAETGYLVPPGDPEAIKEALYALIADPELRKRVGQRGKQHVESFSLDRAVTETVKLYEDILTSWAK